MKYIKLVISLEEKYQEPFIAELLEFDFAGFEQQENRMITYILKELFGISVREKIDRLLAAYPGHNYIINEEIVADRNWNEEWERSVKALQVGKFYIHPTWTDNHPPEGGLIELIIDPKMAFGTGYHETTRLMLKALSDTVADNFEVLDVGTGTGILSIASIKLGADNALAVDTDKWSIENATENIWLNDVADEVEIRKGSMEIIPGGKMFDIVIANINRNTILELADRLASHVKKGGYLLLSGLLVTDKSTILKEKTLRNFKLLDTYREQNWIGLKLRKKSN